MVDVRLVAKIIVHLWPLTNGLVNVVVELRLLKVDCDDVNHPVFSVSPVIRGVGRQFGTIRLLVKMTVGALPMLTDRFNVNRPEIGPLYPVVPTLPLLITPLTVVPPLPEY